MEEDTLGYFIVALFLSSIVLATFNSAQQRSLEEHIVLRLSGRPSTSDTAVCDKRQTAQLIRAIL